MAAWVRVFCGDGLEGAPPQKPTGRPPQLPPRQHKALATLIAEGPVKAGGSAACWRSPLIQPLLDDRFGVFDNVFYISQVLKELGFRSQKAAVVSAHRDAGKRDEWCTTTWPQILRLPNERKARLLLGDAASLPPWGTLTYTWARRGPPPKGKTSGKRTGDTGFGGSDYFTGRLLYHGQDGRLNAAAYLRFLTRVLEHTTPSIVLIQAGAPYHTSAETNAFVAPQTARLPGFQLPTASPDDNPIDKLRKKRTQQDTQLPYFPTFEALTEKVEQALLKFAHAPAAVLALCSLPTELAKVA